MNKGIKLLLIMMVVVSSFFFAYTFNRGNVFDVEKKIQNSEKNDIEDIEKAMKVVIRHFRLNFKGCKLLEIVYDDEFQKEAEAWALNHHAEKAIILQSSFQTDHRGGDGGFNPNDTYTRWKWMLVWEKNQWRLKTWGYG